MIPQSFAKSKMALGLAFVGEFPTSLSPYYPLAGGSLPFDSITPDWSQYHKASPNRLWPRPDKEYIMWLNRMASAKGELWKSVGISDAIMISKNFITCG